MREQRYEAQRLGIGEGRDGEAQNFAQGKVLCENFAQDTIHPPKCKIMAPSNGENYWFLRVGNAG